MTDAELGSWVRIKPSGDVHLVTATATTATTGLRVMACGVDRHVSALTANYPPLARRCRVCVAASRREASA